MQEWRNTRAMDVMSVMTTFVCIADSGSISSAARKLRLSVPMASRHLRALERELGVALVRRTTRRMDLTDAGTELLARARRLLRELDEARQAVRPSKLASGLVAISAPVAFGLAHVAPLVPRLLARHPQLSLDIRFDDRVVDLLGDGVDLAVRVGHAPPDSPFVVSRRLATYERIVCAAPSVLKKRGPVTTVEALASAPCVTLGAAPTRWQFETLEGPKTVVVEGRLRTNNMLAVRDAALAGLGIAQLPRWLIVDELESRRLVRILEGATLPMVSVLGLIHADARRSNTLRLVQDFLAAELRGGVQG
jgi:DNA-binding transcriptional LysR family regulator